MEVMRMAQLNTRIILRNDSTANWNAAIDAKLAKGEIGLEFQADGKIRMKVGDGTLTWAELPYFGDDSAAIQAAIDLAAADATSKADAALAEAKTFVNTQISAVNHLKREIVLVLPEENIDANTIYMVKDSSAIGDTYKEYMLIDDQLVQIGDTSVDLSDYIKTDDAQAAIKTVADNLSDEIALRIQNDTTHSTGIQEAKTAVNDLSGEVVALSGFIGELPEGSTATTLVDYINKKTEGVATESALAELQAQVNSNTEKADANAKSLVDLIATSPEKNKIESIKVDNAALEIAEDRSVEIPAATVVQLGLVKGSEAENSISINEDHTMAVNSLNVNKLAQDEGDWLILNGGSANI
jgi:hypothetical protein